MPSSGRWMALFAGEFRRLRAASFFPSDGKETKGSPGDATDGHFVPIGPPPYPLCRFTTSPPDRGSRPPDPHYGNYPFGPALDFRRAKSGVLGCNSFRPHWGPESAKFRTFAVQDLRLALPNQRYRCESWREAQGPPLRKTKTVTFYRIYRRGGAEGESAEGREKPPWGVPLPPVSRNPPQGRRTGPPAPLAGGG